MQAKVVYNCFYTKMMVLKCIVFKCYNFKCHYQTNQHETGSTSKLFWQKDR